MQILVNEDSDKDYITVDYYLHFKYESSPWWSFVHKYDNLEAARRCIENHKTMHSKSYHSDKKVIYRIMQITKDIKFIYE